MKKNIVVIGAGIGGLSAAALLAKKGFRVTVLEKNKSIGGRVMQFKEKGFIFDVGCSWYMMPEVFDRFYAYFGKKTSDFYLLNTLQTKYRIFLGKKEHVDILDKKSENLKQFELLEKGSAKKIQAFFEKSQLLYDFSLKHLAYKNHDSFLDLLNFPSLKAAFVVPLFMNLSRFVTRFTKNNTLQKILLHSSLFIGQSPSHIPASYCALTNIDFYKQVYYPQGGIYEVIKALESLCKEQKVTIKTDTQVQNIISQGGRAQSVLAGNKRYNADYVISNADYRHTETVLVNKEDTANDFWEYERNTASAFILYFGIKGKVKKLKHHTFILAHEWDDHFKNMYTNPSWPDKPLIYLSVPSQTDASSAPKGCDIIRVYIPISTGVKDTPQLRNAYKKKIINYIEHITGEEITSRLIVDRVFTLKDYKKLYNAYRGSIRSIVPKLFNTGFLRPSNKSKKISNLFYTGQDSMPGLGVPMALISAELAVLRVMDAEKEGLSI